MGSTKFCTCPRLPPARLGREYVTGVKMHRGTCPHTGHVIRDVTSSPKAHMVAPSDDSKSKGLFNVRCGCLPFFQTDGRQKKQPHPCAQGDRAKMMVENTGSWDKPQMKGFSKGPCAGIVNQEGPGTLDDNPHPKRGAQNAFLQAPKAG